MVLLVVQLGGDMIKRQAGITGGCTSNFVSYLLFAVGLFNTIDTHAVFHVVHVVHVCQVHSIVMEDIMKKHRLNHVVVGEMR